MYDISFENCLFHLIIVSVFTQSWHTCTTSTNIIDQNKEIKKNLIFVFNLFYIACIEWTDYCTTGNGGKSTAHVVPALIRVCGFSGGSSRGGAKFFWGQGPPLISGYGWRPPLVWRSGSANGIFCFLQCLISCSVISGSRGGARGAQPPFLDQNEAQRAEKKFFLRPGPPPPYLRVWIRKWDFLFPSVFDFM